MRVLDQLKQIDENPKPLYLVLGNDPFWTELFAKRFQNLIPEDQKTMNFGTYDMESVSISEALKDASSIPFFGDRRAVFVKKPFFLTSKKKKSRVKHNVMEFDEYLDNPNPETVLVLFAPYEKLDARKKVVKDLKKTAEIIDLNKITEREITYFVAKQIKKRGFTIDSDAMNELLTRTNGNLTAIMNELNKVYIYKNEDKNISLNDVTQLVSKSIDQNIFDLVDFLMKGETSKAISFYHDLIKSNTAPIQINAILLSQFRLLLQVKILTEQGMDRGEIAKHLKVHPFRIRLALKHNQNFSLSYLKTAFLKLAENEETLKSTNQNPELLFQMFAISLNDQNKKASL